MTPENFRSIRESLDLSQTQLARALGYSHDANASISRFESGERIPKPWIKRLMLMYCWHGVPDQFMEDDEDKLDNN